jgi:hypothetical protein
MTKNTAEKTSEKADRVRQVVAFRATEDQVKLLEEAATRYGCSENQFLKELFACGFNPTFDTGRCF